ncbi:MAG TPA: MYXO-CTERM sorting domain-containing protein, partial [Tepidisphaeraceae bacterium]
APTKDGGVYQFTLENDDSTSHLITFAYTIAGYPTGTTSGQIGFEGATLSDSTPSSVPEPTTAALGLAGAGLLMRRRRPLLRPA